jgi:hypothetical protein
MSGRSAERGARPGSSPAAARARGRYAFIRAESADRRTRLIQITVYTHVGTVCGHEITACTRGDLIE